MKHLIKVIITLQCIMYSCSGNHYYYKLENGNEVWSPIDFQIKAPSIGEKIILKRDMTRDMYYFYLTIDDFRDFKDHPKNVLIDGVPYEFVIATRIYSSEKISNL